MKLIIDISEYNREWINNGYRIPQEIDPDITRAIIDGEPLEPERKNGKWIPHNTHYTFATGETSNGGVKCSSCGFETHNKAHRMFGCQYKFCPNCGSDMRGEKDALN